MTDVPHVIHSYIEGLKKHDLHRIANAVSDDLIFVLPRRTLNKSQFLDVLKALYSAFPDWHYVNLYGTSVTDRGMESLASCTSLIELNLSRTGVKDESLTTLGELPHLTCLRLWGARITDAGVPRLIELKTLRQLVLNDTAVTPAALGRLKAALPQAEVSP